MTKLIVTIMFFAINLNFVVQSNDQKQYTKLIETYKKQIEVCEQLKNPKAVNACKNKIIVDLAKLNTQNIPEQKELENGDHTSEILTQFAKVVSNFGEVVANPNNKSNVCTGLSNMIAGMINILATATKRLPNIEEELDEDNYSVNTLKEDKLSSELAKE